MRKILKGYYLGQDGQIITLTWPGLSHFCSVSDKKSVFLFLPCSHKNVVAHMDQPKGPFRTKNTTTIEKIVNYYAVVFLLRPPHLLRHGPFLERKMSVVFRKEVSTEGAAIVNHSALANSLRVAHLLRVLFLVRQGPLRGGAKKEKMSSSQCQY